jgi:PAS domain S-box-containing protein
MKINYSKINIYRNERGLSVKGLCKLIGISRSTLWKWEKGLFQPPETKIRTLAEILSIPVSKISDLNETVSKSKHNFPDIIDSWLSLSDTDTTERQTTVSHLLNGISKLNKDLSQSAIIIKALLSSLETIFYIKDYNLNYVTVSESFLKKITKDRDKYTIKGKKDSDIFPASEAQKNHDQDIDIIRTGKEIVNIEDYIPGTRRKKWGLISKRPIFDKDNKVIGLIGTFVDISERKKSEEKRALLERAIDSMGPALSIFDINSGEFLFINKRAFEKQTGYPVEKFYGKKGKGFYLNTFTHPEDRKIHPETIGITKWPKTREKIYRIVRADEEIRWIQTFDSYIKFANKRFIIGLSQDITENKIAEETNTLLQAVLNNSDQILWQIDSTSLKTINVSNNTSDIYGCKPEDIINKENFWLKYIHPKDKTRITKIISNVKALKNPKTFYFEIITANNQKRLINCKFIQNKKSNILTFLHKEEPNYIEI